MTTSFSDEFARALLAAIVHSSEDAIVSTTLEGCITSWNLGAERLFGWTEAEALDRSITLIIPENRLAEEEMVLGRIRQGQRVDHFETVRVTKDRRLVHVSLTISPVLAASGRVIGAAKIVRDITDQRLRDIIRSRLSAIVDSSDDAIVSKTLDGVITSWNIGAERIFGYTAAEAVGQNITLIIPADRLDEERLVLARIRAGDRVDHFETVRRAKDGHPVEISLTVSPIRDAAGTIVGASKVARDITARRAAERAIEDLLAREQAARREADAANRSKDEFLAVLSHELRTPLNAILGWTRMLRTPLLDERQRTHAVEVIERNAELQGQLIADLIDISRITAAKMEIEREPVDLVLVVGAAIEGLAAERAAKNLRLDLHLDDNAGEVLGDARRLQQVVSNLLSNAIKFTPADGWIEVRLARHETSARLTVTDGGEGIEASMLPRIFHPFEQADRSPNRRHRGLGLGLAIVRQLVGLHGGTISAASEGRGRGATFTMDLPVLAVRVQHRPGESGGAPVPRQSSGLAGRRVLLVDDQADARELLTFVLEGAGAHVRAASSGADALGAIARETFDTLVSDLAMPDMDGLELIRELRNAVGGGLYAVAVTAHMDPTVRAEALAAGFDLCITKPVEPAHLIALLERV
jgi:PAS domain S-box-containing protein